MRMSRAIAIGSLVLATGFAAGWNAQGWRRDHGSGTFAQKQYCSTLAEEYRQQQMREHEVSNETYSVHIYHVEYSNARNSCLAQVSATINPPGDDIYTVVDLLSKENLAVDGCYVGGHCDLGHTLTTSDKAFDYAMTKRGDLPLNLRAPGLKVK
jgi:hypothetical protein